MKPSKVKSDVITDDNPKFLNRSKLQSSGKAKLSEKLSSSKPWDQPTCSKYLDTPSQYQSYITILSSSDSECIERSPSPPPHSPFTPQLQFDTQSLSDLLKAHKDEMVQSPPSQSVVSVYRLKIRRKRVYEDAMTAFMHGFPLNKRFSVTFIGELAVDTGGPLREFLHILVMEIANKNNLFEGNDGRVPRPNVLELEKKTYLYVGQMIAVSLLHGGPAPSFFSKAVADYFAFVQSGVSPSRDDVPDISVQNSIQKLQDADDAGALRDVLYSDEFDFRYDCGIVQPVHSIQYSDKKKIAGAMIKYFSFIRCLPQLQQLKEGLCVLGVLQLLQENGAVHHLFASAVPLLSSNELYDLFKPRLSPEGSNRNVEEVTALYQWANYLQAVADGEVSLKNGESGEQISVTLSDLLRFATGAGSIPPLGLIPLPSITFHDDKFPRGNTCANQIVLPLYLDEEAFRYNVSFGILNAAGFGIV